MNDKRKPPKISVVIPCHNAEGTIERVLHAVLTQRVACHEVIVVDNNSQSDDTTRAKVEALNDSRVHYLAPEQCANGNVARNIGSQEATGDYIAYCDSDDIWDEDHIARRVELLKQLPEECAIYSGAKIQNNEKVKTDASRAIASDESPVEFLIGSNKALAQTSSYLVAKPVWERCKWDEKLKRHQDYEFFIAVQRYVGWTYLDTPTYTIFWHGNEVRNHSFESYWQFYLRYKQELSESGRARYLFTRWKEALLFEDGDTYKHYFRAELASVSSCLPFSKRVLFSFPLLLTLLWPIARNYA
ncbi:glycosyltransferase family 2 protein [Alteromonas sp. H39]|uniref:glycosyltransferase family 2 protein n=1 Tax=Alteromonas sp. H39 TaxID=3389876 RepID=UPI0039E1D7F2